MKNVFKINKNQVIQQQNFITFVPIQAYDRHNL